MKEDREAMSADTHVHPMGQEVAVGATQEPGTSNQDGRWRWQTRKMGTGQWLHQMLTSHPFTDHSQWLLGRPQPHYGAFLLSAP